MLLVLDYNNKYMQRFLPIFKEGIKLTFYIILDLCLKNKGFVIQLKVFIN